jgi:ATP-binding cassette subfamily D (ALD) protein 3
MLDLEGEFRACHTGILSHAEEIAFYRGNKWEKERVNADFDDLIAHKNDIYLKRFYMGIFDNMIYKYGANIIGYCLLAIPAFGQQQEKYKKTDSGVVDASNITKDYIRNSSNLINLSKAIGRIIVSYKEMQNLAGYTFLVRKLDKVMSEVNDGKFIRTQVNEDLLKKYFGEVYISKNRLEKPI